MTDYYRGQDEIKPVSCPPMTFSRALEGFVRKTMMGIEPFCEREFLDAFAKTVEASTKIDRLPWSDPNSKPQIGRAHV